MKYLLIILLIASTASADTLQSKLKQSKLQTQFSMAHKNPEYCLTDAADVNDIKALPCVIFWKAENLLTGEKFSGSTVVKETNKTVINIFEGGYTWKENINSDWPESLSAR